MPVTAGQLAALWRAVAVLEVAERDYDRALHRGNANDEKRTLQHAVGNLRRVVNTLPEPQEVDDPRSIRRVLRALADRSQPKKPTTR